MKKKAPKGHTRKHASKKHHATRAKHHPKEISGGLMQLAGQPARVVAKHPHHAKPRGLALAPGDVACCAAEALAASLRLAGGAVSDEDVLALYWHTASDADAGASIWETLDAASRFGLGGIFGVSADRVCLDAQRVSDVADLDRLLGMREQLLGGVAEPGIDAAQADRVPQVWGHGLILGVDLPGPHTVYDDGTAWWSWGEPYDPADFPGAVIEEAWAVRWQ